MSERKKYTIIVLVLILFVASLYLVYKVIDTLRYRTGKPSEILYVDSIDSDVGYDVYLKPNSFYETPFIDNNFSYISALVEYIKTTFKYKYIGTENVGLDYDYYIKGTMTVNYAQPDASLTKPLWVKDFILLDHKRGTASNSKINISEELNIGVDYYNVILADFLSNTGIVANARMDVSFIMNINGVLSNDKPLYKLHQINMTFPLGVRAFDITTSQTFPEHEVTYSKIQQPIEKSYMIAIIYIAMIIGTMGLSVYLIRLLVRKDRSEYEDTLLKLLKDHDDRIVTITNFIRYEKMDVAEIDDFEELLTLSNETMEPILYFEKSVYRHKEAWFSVIKDRILYRYILSSKK